MKLDPGNLSLTSKSIPLKLNSFAALFSIYDLLLNKSAKYVASPVHLVKGCVQLCLIGSGIFMHLYELDALI